MFSGSRSKSVSIIKIVCTCLLLAVTMSLAPAAVRADSREMSRITRERSKVESTLKELKKQLSEYQSKLSSTKKNERRSIADLNNIRNQIKVHERLITENQSLLNHLDGEIDQLQGQLQENRETYRHVSTDFRQVVIAAYKRGGDRDAELMLSSSSVNGAIVRARYMGFLSGSVRSKVNDLQSSAQQLESSRAQLQKTYREKELAMKSQQKELQSYSSKKKEKEQVLTVIQKDKKNYAARITEVRRKQRAMQAKIESLIMAQQELIRKEQERARQEALRRQRLAAERRRMAAESERLKKQAESEKPPTARSGEAPKKPSRQVPATRETPPEEKPVVIDQTESEIDRVSVDFDKGGSLPWPVNNGVVVRKFGSSLDRELNIVTVSNGIDISVPVGTQVKSVSGGKVVQVAFLPTFGNVVIVRHPKSYLTVYANLGRVSVAKGEIIRSRQLLGSSAAMPEGGSTVHFEVWKGKVKQNPQRWLR
ncbi:peptidase M23 [Chlorobaculum limnaeum]|uniref:Peptidase M23 n=2 Tax=Chlorobaculum limnaeum TaxID=274537 RepID=A0A1D8D4H7_CHLLM|nr:peptidase M23 [Chlorobaculum limnaeum]